MELSKQPRSFIEVLEISESIRVYSTEYVQDNWAADIISGIASHPYVETVNSIVGGPILSFEVIVSDPQHWDRNIDPHCREIIGAAIKAQHMQD